MRPFSFATSLAVVLLASSTVPAYAEVASGPSPKELAEASLFERYVASHLRAYHHRVSPETKKDQVPSFSSSPLAHGAASHLSHLSSLLENAHDLTAVSPVDIEELGRKAKVTFRHAYLSATRPLKRFFPTHQETSPVVLRKIVKRSEHVSEIDGDDHEGSDWSWLDGDDEGEEEDELESEKLFFVEELAPGSGVRMELRKRKQRT